MNILERIDQLMDEGCTEENAYYIVDGEYGLNGEEDKCKHCCYEWYCDKDICKAEDF